MAKSKVYYECSHCGHTTVKWMGQCPSCNQWHTFQEFQKQKESERIRHKIELTDEAGRESGATPKKLAEIDVSGGNRTSTGLPELDRVLGGGLMPASLILLGGDPGIGKSTLMLHVAKSRPDLEILYVAGEESAGQIRQRADRIGIQSSELRVVSDTDLDRVISLVQKEKPQLLVIDSIQTVYRSQLAGLPGSVQQVRECAALLQQVAKKEGVTTLMIGHVTKEGDIAGPRVLEHMVDTVLQFEGDQSRLHRLLRCVKNRFGAAHEVGVFEMGEQGLTEVDNPSSLFLSDHDQQVSGNVVTCIMEGSRPILVEVQALVTPGTYGVPQRTASGFDQRRLSLLIAVLEKRVGLKLSDQDVYLNIAGGLKVTDTAADLAVITALASSFGERALAPRTVVVGEAGLGGELRNVPHLEQRLREADKMGFERALIPSVSRSLRGVEGLVLSEKHSIGHAIRELLDTSS
ncbi:MAG: DNA repair protein RadA [Balneolaceae bacterium]